MNPVDSASYPAEGVPSESSFTALGRKEYNRRYHLAHREQQNAAAREYHAENKERIRAQRHEYRVKNKSRMAAYSREYRARNKDQVSAHNRTRGRERRAKLRAQFFAIYGKECACGEKDTRFLTLAHKNNDGKQDRRENGQGRLVRRAIEHPDYTRYETQCYKCQRIGWRNHLATKAYADNSKKANTHRIRVRENRHRWQLRVFKEYGFLCACCGETDQRVLQLAHKNNDGAQDRRVNGEWLMLRRSLEHPDHGKYEILCANCNEGANANGGVCPHEVQIVKAVPILSTGANQSGGASREE